MKSKIQLPAKGTPDWHQLQIAKKTLGMIPEAVGLMGGMTRADAEAIYKKWQIKIPSK